ncbi:MAG: hypothetical protein HWQ43_19550 [Nostoc sp. JL31]|uniref:hypothetical protein n=1 Tax=Nostoc sp. JL31 TaxID=2815395 RepID=UPI0025F74370|nr:hypothetical protein [Nostoc sp. JL31]MBN3891249.1 hypothetical protein [Nostoc sp. JL31]
MNQPISLVVSIRCKLELIARAVWGCGLPCVAVLVLDGRDSTVPPLALEFSRHSIIVTRLTRAWVKKKASGETQTHGSSSEKADSFWYGIELPVGY